MLTWMKGLESCWASELKVKGRWMWYLHPCEVTSGQLPMTSPRPPHTDQSLAHCPASRGTLRSHCHMHLVWRSKNYHDHIWPEPWWVCVHLYCRTACWELGDLRFSMELEGRALWVFCELSQEQDRVFPDRADLSSFGIIWLFLLNSPLCLQGMAVGLSICTNWNFITEKTTINPGVEETLEETRSQLATLSLFT